MNQKKFSDFYSQMQEREEHKKSKEYKKLSPKMKKAVDDTFKKMDAKPQNFLNTFDKSIKDSAKRFGVQTKELMKYFEREMLSIM